MRVGSRKLAAVFELCSTRKEDFRGFLVRTYDLEVLKGLGGDRAWVEESWSHTNRAYTLRGLHVQLPPYAEAKLISVIRGIVKWVVVDVRKDSATFGQWDAITLSADRCNGLYVGRGFAHGCLSLSDDCDLVIRADQEFMPSHGTGIIWNDPILGIEWGLGEVRPTLSERDQDYPPFEDFLKNVKGM